MAVAILIALGSGVAARGDEAVAEFLLEQGKKAMAQRNWDEAISRFERAREENPACIEATYLAATAHERKDDVGAALRAYRSFRDAAEEQEKAGTLDRRVGALRGKAEKRIGVLGRGEKELVDEQAAFAKRIVAFAAKHAGPDPDLARHALDRLLAAQPRHEKARELRAEVGGDPRSAMPENVPIPGITKWDDLLARKALENGGSVTYGRGVARVDERGGSVYWLDGRTHAADPFVYVIEWRVMKEHAPGALVGLAFARRPLRPGQEDDCFMAFGQKSKVVLVHGTEGQNHELAEAAVPAVAEGTWRRLMVEGAGNRVRVYLDGKRIITHDLPMRDTTGGQVGVTHQRCEAEIRSLTLGRKP